MKDRSTATFREMFRLAGYSSIGIVQANIFGSIVRLERSPYLSDADYKAVINSFKL